MKAITICQPHAWAIIHGPKEVENRTWPTSYRGPLIIHAGKSKEWLDGWPYPEEPDEEDLVFGAFIGVVDIVDCLRLEDLTRRTGGKVPYAFGPWCHLYANRRPLKEPIPWRGDQGLWEVPQSALQDLHGEGGER